MLAVAPALLIILYSGIELRKQSIQHAENQVLQLTHTMALSQEGVSRSSRQFLSTLSLLPAVKALDPLECSDIFRGIALANPSYFNISLTDIRGEVIASNKPFTNVSLADRKHIRDALETRDFAAGEYMVTRLGVNVPAFAFSYPVLDRNGVPTAVLSLVLDLNGYSAFYDPLDLPEDSFIAITDHQGLRLFYYPPKKSTNPVGKPIKATNWEMVSAGEKTGMFVNSGSDGMRRIFAFEQIRLAPEASPYLYVWAAIPETYVLGPANGIMFRNILLLLAATAVSLCISWLIGRQTEKLIASREQALQEIKTLRGILPICSFCKKIRNDEGYYEQIEGYIHKHSDVDFSHTVCPDCLQKHYPKELWDSDTD